MRGIKRSLRAFNFVVGAVKFGVAPTDPRPKKGATRV